MEASPKKWVRTFFPSNRYNIMTTNIAECMNVVLRDAKSLPLVPLVEVIRLLLQDWFYERRTQVEAATTSVTPWLEKILTKRLNEYRQFNVTPLNKFEFEVPPEVLERVVYPPMVPRALGRPRTRRILSRGEERPHRKCSRCGVFGHNR